MKAYAIMNGKKIVEEEPAKEKFVLLIYKTKAEARSEMMCANAENERVAKVTIEEEEVKE